MTPERIAELRALLDREPLDHYAVECKAAECESVLPERLDEIERLAMIESRYDVLHQKRKRLLEENEDLRKSLEFAIKAIESATPNGIPPGFPLINGAVDEMRKALR